MDGTGANEYSLEELEELFKEDTQPTTPAANEDTTEPQNTDGKDEKPAVDTTKAFATRLKESTDKAKREERESIAKSLGYESYDAMVKTRESKLLEDKGLDPAQVTPIVEQLVKQRLDNDPRMLELDELRKKQIAEFGKKELAEITKLTNGEITKLSQLPSNVIELWKTKGSLKSAYMEIEGEKLITKMRSAQSKGSTDHLTNLSGTSGNNLNTRPLTNDEKQAWKLFNPNMSDEELNKKFTNI